MQIPVKIKAIGQRNQSPRGTVNLNQDGSTVARPAKKACFYVWLLVLLALIEGGIIVFSFLTKTPVPYQSLIPADSISVIYFNQSYLADLAKSLKGNQYGWPPLSSFSQDLEQFFKQANLSTNDLQPLFEAQMALILLAGANDNPLQWLLIATKKIEESEFEFFLDKAQKNLKQNFDLRADVYRQTTITIVKSLNQSYKNLYFAHLKNLFLLSNNADIIKSTIDKALK